MNAETKAKWLVALRSGKYQQGQGYLRTGDKYCCLGVLCDIQEPKKWTPAGSGGLWSHCGMELMPSTALSSKSELGIWDAKDLSIMNDAGKTFDEIAQHIEKTL